MTRTIISNLILFSAVASLAAIEQQEPRPIFNEVTARGRALYEYDQAAWHATDAVRATHPPEQSVGRYIARKSGGGWTVVFGHLNDRRDAFLVAYEAVEGATLQEFKVKKLDPPEADTSFYLAAKAIDLALHDFQGEKRPYNVAVLPASSNQLYVYMIPAQTKTGVYPYGGDVRYLITADGNAIIGKLQFHRDILDLMISLPISCSTSNCKYHL